MFRHTEKLLQSFWQRMSQNYLINAHSSPPKYPFPILFRRSYGAIRRPHTSKLSSVSALQQSLLGNYLTWGALSGWMLSLWSSAAVSNTCLPTNSNNNNNSSRISKNVSFQPNCASLRGGGTFKRLFKISVKVRPEYPHPLLSCVPSAGYLIPRLLSQYFVATCHH